MARLLPIALLLATLCPLPSRADDLPASRQVRVVELFAAQGCSLCPDAGAFVNRIAAGESGFEDVAPLVYHLPIVDGLGWKDRFASPDFTALHTRATEAAGLAEGFVPMFLVQGEGALQLQGPVEARLRSSRGTAAAVRVEVRGETSNGAVSLDVTVRGPLKGVEVSAVAFENGLSTPVTDGKNRGRTLTESAVVRTLCPPVAPTAAGKAQFRIEAGKDWRAGQVGYVVIARNRETLKILGAARINAGPAASGNVAGAAPGGRETVTREGGWDVMTLDSGGLGKISTPKGLARNERPGLIVMLHGWGGDPDGMLRFGRELADHRRSMICAPRGSRAIGGPGTGWDPDTDVATIAELTRRVSARWSVDPTRVSILGFSAGGAMAALTCVREKDLYNGCVSCATTEIPASGQGFEGIRAVFFLGDRDENFSLAPEARSAIRTFAPHVAFRVVRDLGHEAADPVYLNDALNFLAQRSETGDEQTLPLRPNRRMAPVILK